MIVVNTTFHVESSIAKEWVAWVHATYLVNAVERCSMSSPLFMKFLRQLEEEAKAMPYSFSASRTRRLKDG